ncbi:vitamin K epoxide reductase family protein [Pyrobaculum sp.]|uniref:vitamin K epoxide reductase family protein n=1 Tax=Pyrobaculum sp. TaxID=2004705 RepID=UPI003D0E8CCF
MRYLLVALALSAAGILSRLAGYEQLGIWLLAAGGLAHTLLNKPGDVCRRGRLTGCEVVLGSPYARPLGIPLEYVGAAWFGGVPLAFHLGYGQIWALLAVLGVVLLIGIEVKLKALCLYCTVAHIIGLICAVFLLL